MSGGRVEGRRIQGKKYCQGKTKRNRRLREEEAEEKKNGRKRIERGRGKEDDVRNTEGAVWQEGSLKKGRT